MSRKILFVSVSFLILFSLLGRKVSAEDNLEKEIMKESFILADKVVGRTSGQQEKATLEEEKIESKISASEEKITKALNIKADFISTEIVSGSRSAFEKNDLRAGIFIDILKNIKKIKFFNEM